MKKPVLVSDFKKDLATAGSLYWGKVWYNGGMAR